MHEWALAEAVIEALIRCSKGKEVQVGTVAIGELQQVDLRVFEYALKILMRERGLKGGIKLVVEKALLKCRECGYEWLWEDTVKELDEPSREAIHFIPELVHAFVKCPNCGSRDYDIIKGRGVYIRELKLV